MVTREQLKEGLSRYAEKELAGKVAGLRKWAILIALPSVAVAVDEFISRNQPMLMKAGYLTEDGMVDIARIHREAKDIARSTGAVTEHLPVLGDVTFSELDIDALANMIGGVNETD